MRVVKALIQPRLVCASEQHAVIISCTTSSDMLRLPLPLVLIFCYNNK